MEEAATEAAAIDEHVYRVIEVVGSSPRSIEAAIESALARAHSTLRNLRWFDGVIVIFGALPTGSSIRLWTF